MRIRVAELREEKILIIKPHTPELEEFLLSPDGEEKCACIPLQYSSERCEELGVRQYAELLGRWFWPHLL